MMEACAAAVSTSLLRVPPWSADGQEVEAVRPAVEQPFSCLSSVDLFADLNAAEVAKIDEMAPSRTLVAGELIFSQSQPTTALFILKAGRVRIFRLAEDGKALTMAILEPGAVFGEMLLVGQRMYDNYAEAIEDVVICRLEAREVERYLLADPRIAIRVARHLGEQVAVLEERLMDLAVRPLETRLASTLVRLAAPERRTRQGFVTIRLTHDQLAGLLAATRESTSKAMADLASRSLIRQARGRITLLDLDGLAILAKRRPEPSR